jgi:hypothetical protein
MIGFAVDVGAAAARARIPDRIAAALAEADRKVVVGDSPADEGAASVELTAATSSEARLATPGAGAGS